MVHDMLHMRGGHQVNWFFDGIPVVNTNIAANVAPLINPKNVEELEVERGGFSSEYGDRTYGFFNVVTPSGFERDNQAELILSGGNFDSTDDQFNIGGHTERFAYYASIDGNRSDLGLGTPVSAGDPRPGERRGRFPFAALQSQLDKTRCAGSHRCARIITRSRTTRTSRLPASATWTWSSDDLVGFHWAHSFSDGVLFSLSPYFHFNVAHYVGGPLDTPFILDDNGRSAYLGGRAVLQAQKKRHNARVGVEVWGQHDRTFFGLTANPGGNVLNQQENHWANSNAVFLEDQYKAASWLTLDLGLRLTHYSGLVNENAADPRLGGSDPHSHAGLDAARLLRVLLPAAAARQPGGAGAAIRHRAGLRFVPLHGERDIQHDIGLSIPLARLVPGRGPLPYQRAQLPGS